MANHVIPVCHPSSCLETYIFQPAMISPMRAAMPNKIEAIWSPLSYIEPNSLSTLDIPADISIFCEYAEKQTSMNKNVMLRFKTL